MTKMIRFKVSDGRVYEFKASVVANHRAVYYADQEADPKEDPVKWTKVFSEELDYARESTNELLDWAVNSMNWADVAMYAYLVKDGSLVNPQDDWDNSDNFKVIDA